ncbi:hypothetical protein D3C81_1679430 [compost metagenome]
MLACGGFFDVRWKVFKQLDVIHQRATRQCTFKQIMAEHGVFRHLAGQGTLEGIDIVQALAGITAPAEHILVHIGDCAAVWIHPAARRKEAAI